MAIDVDDLVRRQAAVLTEIERMKKAELEFLANQPLPKEETHSEANKARKLLRGLVRSRVVGIGAHPVITEWLTDKPTVVPALPGFFVISLMPRSDGTFDREQVLKEPVVAWRVNGGNYAEPIRPGLGVIDRWAVLTPAGYVITDEYTNLFGEAPLALKDWIKSEIEWLESESGGPVIEFPTVCRRVFEYSGPLAKAFGLMMAGRRDWVGTPEEMLETLSKFGDETSAAWPSSPAAMLATLQELGSKLADADLFVATSDDGRLVVYRAGYGEPGRSGSLETARQNS